MNSMQYDFERVDATHAEDSPCRVELGLWIQNTYGRRSALNAEEYPFPRDRAGSSLVYRESTWQ